MNQHTDIKAKPSFFYRPVKEPRNETASTLCSLFLQEFGFPMKGKRGRSYTIAVASLLHACQSPFGRIGIARKASAWTKYPMVGKDLGLKVVDAFEDHGYIARLPETGTYGWHQDDFGTWKTNPILTVYEVHPDAFPSGYMDARFIEAACELVKVNRIEGRQQRATRQTYAYQKPRLTKTQAKNEFGQGLKAIEDRLEGQNQYWSEHPIVFPNGDAACCATRIYHDESLISGGRLYGMWTNTSGPERRSATINGEAVVEIDISGSQPTLLNSLRGYKLNGISPSGTWWDVYTQITGLWDYYGDDVDKAREVAKGDKARKVAKGVCMEIIGSGNPQKRSPSTKLEQDTGVTQQDYDHFRSVLIECIPSLNDLEPRFDEFGDVYGYLNGAGYLPYHESEMIMATLEALKGQNVPAYPVHDSLIVKQSDVLVAAQTLRATICEYCYTISGLKVFVPIKVKDSKGLRSDLIPQEDQIGYYP